ncbi:tripartite motif-containing protein 16-like protein [Neolamprologus brichardi]|uniref:tripartite motif-containing protein 16-like protein n=1 Tax=Neolamprologus brichardi TaxID=32507 RepID=UPI0016437CDC|nr:tripartite motif-containing protein 16-like protein [Neolamprologus brichardi]
MVLQNRLTLDLITASQGGVCKLIGETCCTFIPDGYTTGGDISEALQNLTALQKYVADHTSGGDASRGCILPCVTAAVSKLRAKVQDILRDTWVDVSPVVDVNPQTEPKTRADFLKYSFQITLDPNTVNTQLSLSEGNRRATLMREEQSYPTHPDRFIRRRQVLSNQSLTGRRYWEVEWCRKRVTVALAYKDISREGSMSECAFGFNDKSWALECNCSSSFKFIHNSVKTGVSSPWTSRLGVYLDHSAGVLAFYSVSESMTLLHRVQTAFTQPLYAGLWFSGYHRATAEFIELGA